MIPLTTLYDEYIDGSKLSEQKKPFEYIVPPPSRGVGTMICSNIGVKTKDTVVICFKLLKLVQYKLSLPTQFLLKLVISSEKSIELSRSTVSC